MGIQAREGGFVPEVKRLTARGRWALTVVSQSKSGAERNGALPAMAEAAAWCANPWREIGTAKTNHQSGYCSPPKADSSRTSRHVRFVPENETARAVGAAAWGAGVPAMDGRWERVA